MKRLIQIVLCLISATILYGCGERPLKMYVVKWADGRTEEVLGTSYIWYVMNRTRTVVVKVYNHNNDSFQSFIGDIEYVKSVE